MPAIPATEITDLLRRIAAGSVPLTAIEHGSSVVIEAGGYWIAFFDDAGDLDYVESAIAPDGRSSEFDDWWKAIENDPFGLLSEDERDAVQRTVRKSTMAFSTAARSDA